jgi:putative ABC transport system permease protein
MMAYDVQQRTHEIGIRIALGASAKDVLGLVIARGLLLIAVAFAIGVANSLVLTRFLATLLWEVTPADPLTYVIVILGITSAAMLACYLPARRAAAIDAAITLRSE